MTPTFEPAKLPRVYYAGLDGLRALAVIAVLLYHLFPGVLPGGFLGVDVFFVISGFLITALLIRERVGSGRVNLIGFWRRRVRRLLPAVVTLVIVCTSLAWMLGGDILVSIGRQVLGAVTFSNNWLDIAAGSSYFDQDVPELYRNLWSLAIEEQFYLLWPFVFLLLMLLPRVAARWVIPAVLALGSAGFMAALFSISQDATRVYFGTDTHSFGLMVGAAGAFALVGRGGPGALKQLSRPKTALLGALGLIALAATLATTRLLTDDNPLSYLGGMFAVSLLVLMVIWAATTPGSWLGRVLDTAPLRAIGLRSYSLYLWHWPLLLVVSTLGERLLGPEPNYWFVGCTTTVVTFAAAWVSYRFVEEPIRRHGFRSTFKKAWAALTGPSSRRSIVIAGLACFALAVSGTVAGIVTAPSQSSAQEVIERGAASLEAAPDPRAYHQPPYFMNGLVPPPKTDKQEAPIPTGNEITAVGDSVMLAAAPELRATMPGIYIDAAVSRSMWTAPGILKKLAAQGKLRSVVVLGLGTNGPISVKTLHQVSEILGPERTLVLVNAQAPRSWTAGVNTTLADFARQNRRSVAVADWQGNIADQLNLLAGDKIHPGPRGGQVYADTVLDAITFLAQLLPPPHLDVRGPGPFAS